MNPSPTNVPKKIYVAGPMQGVPYFNFPRFHAVTAGMRDCGHEVFNPAEEDIKRNGGVDISASCPHGLLSEIKGEHVFSLRQALKEDTAFICGCDIIVMLPGWEKSNGAQAEHRLAVALQSEGVEIVYLSLAVCNMMEVAARITASMAEGQALEA